MDRTPFTIMRWTGRILATLIAMIILLTVTAMMIGSDEPFVWESVAVVILFGSSVVAGALSWWKVKIAGYIYIFLAALFSIFVMFSAGRNHWMPIVMVGVPHLAVGLMLLFGWWKGSPDFYMKWFKPKTA